MKTTADIVEYIQLRLDLAHILYQSVVPDTQDEEGNLYPNPLVIDDQLVMENVDKVAFALGTTTKDLLEGTRTNLWNEKFAYFKLYSEAIYAERAALLHVSYGEYSLMQAIFGDKDERVEASYRPRYNIAAVQSRLLTFMDRNSQIMQEAKPNGGTMKNFRAQMNCFYHFKKIEGLYQRFLDVVRRGEVLFFKALKGELTEIEQHEYNFIVSALGIHDAVMSYDERLYYPLLCIRRELYLSENLTTFFDYVNISNWPLQKMFRCIEFWEDDSRLQYLVSRFPYIKNSIRTASCEIENFYCIYDWEDEQGNITDGEPVYVAKTQDELGEDATYLKVLKQLCAPASKGGLQGSKPREVDVPRVMARLNLQKEAEKR
ncbi:MAG: hypothetical protein SNI70_03680 [Rikenellaceae bacterium]